MKKLATIFSTLLIAFTLNAQQGYSILEDRNFMAELLKSVAILLLFAIIATFFLNLIRMILDYRLKNKMLDKGVSENLASQFLKTGNSKNEVIKWFAILCGIGVGLVLVALFPPFGIHSLIIIVFSLAASFLGYHFYANRSNR